MLFTLKVLALLLPFSLPQMNSSPAGHLYRSEDHKCAVYVIESYFNECPYCNDNAENVWELADRFKEWPRVQVIDLGIDRSDSDYEAWISKHTPNHPVLKDAGRILTKELGTSGYPTAYVVGSNGNVTRVATGVWSQAKINSIEANVHQQLNQPCAE